MCWTPFADLHTFSKPESPVWPCLAGGYGKGQLVVSTRTLRVLTGYEYLGEMMEKLDPRGAPDNDSYFNKQKAFRYYLVFQVLIGDEDCKEGYYNRLTHLKVYSAADPITSER